MKILDQETDDWIILRSSMVQVFLVPVQMMLYIKINNSTYRHFEKYTLHAKILNMIPMSQVHNNFHSTLKDCLTVYINPHTNMWGPRGPRKTLIAALSVNIGISEPMF